MKPVDKLLVDDTFYYLGIVLRPLYQQPEREVSKDGSH